MNSHIKTGITALLERHHRGNVHTCTSNYVRNKTVSLFIYFLLIVNAELVFFLFRYNLAVSGFLIVRYVLMHFSADPTLTCHEAANVIVTDDVTFGSHDVSLTPHFLRFPPANSPLGFAILFVFRQALYESVPISYMNFRAQIVFNPYLTVHTKFNYYSWIPLNGRPTAVNRRNSAIYGLKCKRRIVAFKWSVSRRKRKRKG